MVKSVILAAGKGTRMKSDKPKVVHQVMGKPMVYYSIEAARQAGADEVCVIVGYKVFNNWIKARRGEVSHSCQCQRCEG